MLRIHASIHVGITFVVAGAGREVVLMYTQPSGMGRDYQAEVDILYVMQV